MAHGDKLERLSPWQRLSASRAKAYEYMPYFRSGLQSLVPVEAEGLRGVGVTEGAQLLIDLEWLGTLTAVEGACVVLHEYLHLYFEHTRRFNEMLRRGVATQDDRGTYNEAADMEINDNLVEAGMKLPLIDGSPMLLATQQDLPPHRTAEEYFVALKKKKQEGKDQGDGKAPPMPGAGHCGSGAGNPLPQEPEQDDEQTPARSPGEQAIQHKRDSEGIQQASERGSGRGTVPAGLKRFAQASLEPAKVPWQQKLQQAMGKALAEKAGMVDYTWRERARFQGAAEFFYGEEAPVLPGLCAPLAEVALVVDTSGSMGDEQIQRIINEAQGILQNLGGARLTVVACDAEVHALVRVKDAREIKSKLKGGGGTAFEPAFKALDKATPRPDIIVFGTDGYGSYPDHPPVGQQVIWLQIDGKIQAGWGEVIELDKADLAEEQAA